MEPYISQYTPTPIQVRSAITKFRFTLDDWKTAAARAGLDHHESVAFLNLLMNEVDAMDGTLPAEDTALAEVSGMGIRRWCGRRGERSRGERIKALFRVAPGGRLRSMLVHKGGAR